MAKYQKLATRKTVENVYNELPSGNVVVTPPEFLDHQENMNLFKNSVSFQHFSRLFRHQKYQFLPNTLVNFSSSHESYWKAPRNRYIPILVVGSLYAVYESKKLKAFAHCKSSFKHEPGGEKDGLPSYSAEEVSKHSSESSGIWVTYKSGVYDITKFVKEHPGGNKIMMAAGGQLEPFWDLFAIHKREDVFQVLEKYRIGNLMAEDRETGSSSVDHWSNEPRRHPVLLVRSKQPFNAEPPAELLVENFITPK